MKRLLIFGFLSGFAMLYLFSCQKELSQESNLSTGTFSLHNDSTKMCYPVTVNGTYYNGVSAQRDTNFITVVVNVESTGSYKISTDSSNGFLFSDSGFFSNTGLDTLILTAKGAPILMQPTNFTFPADSLGSCGFLITVQDSTGTGLGSSGGSSSGDSSYIDPNTATTNTWHFTDTITKVTYHGTFLPLQGGGFSNDTLIVVGLASSTDTAFGFSLVIPSKTITPGIYPVNAGNAIGLQITASQADIYIANNITASESSGNSYITIVSYSGSQLTGSFHAYAEFNGAITLIEGSFNCTVP